MYTYVDSVQARDGRSGLFHHADFAVQALACGCGFGIVALVLPQGFSSVFTRYAVYVSASGLMAQAGAAWLGWDLSQGVAVRHPDIKQLDVAALTDRPRKYGFHGTVKAPFTLAKGTDGDTLKQAFSALCKRLNPVTLEGLEIATLGRFMALVPIGDQTMLGQLAAQVVRDLDGFRAPPTEADFARRRKSNLSARQEAHLMQWGYPHVMDQFLFHMTLTGPVPRKNIDVVAQQLTAYFAPVLPAPFVIDTLTLVGEDTQGRFSQILQAALDGEA